MEIKAYKGVMIYFNEREGQFFCNIAKNTGIYQEKTFNSKRFEGIKKSIDNADAEKVTAQTVYQIHLHNGEVTPLQVVAKKGHIYSFNNGHTNVSSIHRNGWIYQESVLKTEGWKKVISLASEYKEVREKQTELNKKSNEMYRKMNLEMKKLIKHKLI